MPFFAALFHSFDNNNNNNDNNNNTTKAPNKGPFSTINFAPKMPKMLCFAGSLGNIKSGMSKHQERTRNSNFSNEERN